MLGHIALAAVPGAAGLVIGLVLVAFGSGGVKANASTIVASLYGVGDDRRDAGFSIFYLGVNLGAFTGPLLTDWLRLEWGFHVGFGVAAFGMALGLIQYMFYRRALPATGSVVPNPLPAAARNRVLLGAVLAVAVVAVLVANDVFAVDRLKWIVFGIVLVATVGYFGLLLTSSRVERVERRRVLAFAPMWVASVMFWAIFQQIFTVVAIYSDQRLDRTVLGFEIPPAWTQSIEPVFVILLADVFAAIWTKLGPRQPSSPTKMAIGTVVVGLAFMLFVPLAGTGPNGTPLLALVGILLVFCLAELFISPVGQSLSTKLAPRAFQTQMVALFFLSVSMGTVLSGVLAGYYSPQHEVAYFGLTGVVAVIVGVVVLAFVPKIKVLMEGLH